LKRKIGFIIALVAMLSMMVVPAGALADNPSGSVGLGAVVYDNALTLENKDALWAPILTDNIGATLLYNDSGDVFEWDLQGNVPSGSYTLIYYADMPDRFTDWGGSNPGAVITAVASVNGIISANGTTDLGMNLPCFPDANEVIANHDYSTAPDKYSNAIGAKIWLVPSADLPAGWPNDIPWTSWTPANILFETDLITYTDTNAIVSITVFPVAIDFGRVAVGTTISDTVTVANNGSVPVNVTASAGGGFTALMLNGEPVLDYDADFYKNMSAIVNLSMVVPAGSGPLTGTLLFVASPASP